ncbi:hypothetical protein KVT40_000341 [Elsinoe batatas]|uniref:Uncharacterized protein n=1 Tax=Elsinoe batatas TaxID=2601811 RepID=A0A8K0PIJ4_9PEZI|nr:hypothetical protein KVT40_000341 [Elsinoe batatas]
MASDLKRSPSFSLRKSFETTRFRRKHADSTATVPDYDPPPPVPQLPRASTTQFDEPKSDGPKLSKRKSVRDLWNATLAPKISRRGTRKTKVEHVDFDRQRHVVNFSAMAEQDKSPRRDNSSDFSFEPSTVRSSAYSGSDNFKPLGAHPPPNRMETVREESQVRSLREADLRKMFFGAPLFTVSGSRDHPKPQATYRDQDPDSTQDGRDALDFQHSSFQVATLLSADGGGLLDGIKGASHVCELPSMLGLHGLEPGTVGMDHFLQLPLSLAPEVSRDARSNSNRVVIQTDPESLGMRAPSIERLIDRLTELGDLQAQRDIDGQDLSTSINEQKASEMYADLFAKLLTPPKYTPAAEVDPTGLNVQISALVKALNLPNLWYDLSIPDERLRIGKVIWAAHGESGAVEVVNDRNVLLLQITLAAELLTRLEPSQTGSDSESEDESVGRRRPAITRKVAWDLVLAKRFLADVRIAPATIDAKAGRDPNRSSLFSMLSFVTAREDFEEDEEIQPVLYPRNEKAQLTGLVVFAMALDWPHVDELKQKMANRSEESQDGARQTYTAPVGTPTFKPDDRDSYFGVLVRPHMGRSITAQSVQLLPPIETDQSTTLNAAGWLSRSWLTGLVMPGESASHLLISSLLENSSNALSALGDTANLTGGFTYRNRSYWSKSCVVGRVLAALNGAYDCMAWISAPPPGQSHDDGWINISSLPITTNKPRIKSAGLIASSSAPYPDPKAETIQEADFVWPTDGPPVLGNEVRQHVLTFESSPTTFELSTPVPQISSNDSISSNSPKTISALPTSQAVITFTPPRNTKFGNLTVPLKYDVYFVASQPCFPKMRTPQWTPRKSVTIASDEKREKKDKELPAPPCHPVLKKYAFEVAPALVLLGDDERVVRFKKPAGDKDAKEGRDRQDSGAGRSPRVKLEDPAKEDQVLVLDCRGSGDLQLLARAWCAKVGEHALVGRVERTCLGCCIREARALGINIVIRI